MERADQRDKGKRIVEDVSVELTLGLDGFRGSPKNPKILNRSSSMVDVEHSGYDNSNRNVKEFQFSILRTASLLPMETEVEWMQRNDPFSIMRTSSLPMETEMEWRQRNDPFSIMRTSSLPMETEVEWRQRKETEMEWRQRKETEMEWRQRNDPFSIIRTASLPMETEVEWRQGKELPMGTEVDWRQTNDPFSIMRTSSLPMETEVEWRQRNEPPMQTEMDWRQKRELQTQMRREARQKRWDQMKNVKVVKENGVNGNCSLPSSDGSQGSAASSESGFETQQQQLPFQGASGSSNMIPPAASGMSLEQMQQLLIAATDTTNEKSPVFSGKEVIRNFMLNMPGVSAKGNGPNGKKTEGFLYAYKKGEEVKIVCVCHGNFLTPAEFLKHAGGGDVENPLKYITIDPINEAL